MNVRDDTKDALLAGLVVGLVSLVIVLSVWNETANITPRLDVYYLTGFVGLGVVGAILVPGIVVAAYLRYGLVSPFAVFAADILFWTTIASGGDGPAWVFVFMFWPAYVLAYALLGSIEFSLRRRGVGPPLRHAG